MNPSFLLASVASGFLLFFVLRKFYKPLFLLSEASLGILNSLLMPEEDEEKVKQVEKNLKRLLLALALFFLLIIGALVAAAIPLYAFGFIQDIPFSELELGSWQFILGLSLGSILPFINFKKKDSLSYSELSKLFHRLFLDNYNVSKKLFSFETKRYGKSKEELRNDFVMVSGLARAGTTSLMLNLNETQKFASLDYSNMPLILGPNIWRKFYSPKSKEKKEREHGDGIQVGLNSAEALEEYFFKAHLNDSYIQETSLSSHKISEELYDKYLLYQSVLLDGDKRYLAKNNNFLLRYPSLRSLNKDFKVVFMFREPLQHAYSLLKQHRHYLLAQKEDGFILEYMNWLGHHEFGLGQKEFQFRESETDSSDKDSLDYWLSVWINYYQHLFEFVDDENTFLVNYKDYCEKPQELLQSLINGIGIDHRVATKSAFANNKEVKEAFSQDLYTECKVLYNKLLTKSLSV